MLAWGARSRGGEDKVKTQAQPPHYLLFSMVLQNLAGRWWTVSVGGKVGRPTPSSMARPY